MSAPEEEVQITFDGLWGVLEGVDKQLDALHGRHVPMGVSGANRKDVAAVTRELLRLADRFELAAALVRSQYWEVRGMPLTRP